MDDLIRRQDVINAVEERIQAFLKDEIFKRKNGDRDLYGVKRLIQNLPSAQQWIPCSERLPSGQENVIVTVYDDHGDTPWEYTTNAWHIDGVWIADNDIVCGSVIAWMPLPEPWGGVKG